MIFDFHIHSRYSFDSILSPRDILKTAKRKGLDGIAITDHNTIRGGLETKKLNKDENFYVIIGSEINTDMGDIIGLFLNDEIKSRDSQEVIDEIHQQDGLVILPHPFRNHKLNENIISLVDIIEIYNSRSTIEENNLATMIAEINKKPKISGSDAHFKTEIGLSKTEFQVENRIRTSILKNDTKIYTSYSSSHLQILSQIIKSIKTKRYLDIPIQSVRLTKGYLKNKISNI